MICNLVVIISECASSFGSTSSRGNRFGGAQRCMAMNTYENGSSESRDDDLRRLVGS